MIMLKLVLFTIILSAASASPITGRIVNGTDANEGEFPFIVSFRAPGGSHKCGASILSSKYILTAAHCSDSLAGQTIQYGVTKIARDGENIVPIVRQIRHESYSYATLSNDIALLELEYDIEFSQYVEKIQLPELDEVFHDDDIATLIGWGLNSSYGTLQEHLQKVELFIVNYPECSRIHGSMVTETNICAGVPEGWKGQCSGDSGGPLIFDNKVIGIVSWSVKPCTVPPYPGVYTRVSHFVDWIKKNANL